MFQVSYLGTVHLEVIAKRLSLPDNLVRGAGVELRIWLKQGKEKRLLARILKFLEKARKRLSRQNSTKKCVNLTKKVCKFDKKVHKFNKKCVNVREKTEM